MTVTAVLAQEQSHNPLLPETFDILWSTVCVVIIGLAFWKYVLPKFQEVLSERTEKIEGGIAKAEPAQSDARAALERYNAQLAEARGEAARIRDDARAQGQLIIDEMKVKAQQESERIIASGHNQLMAQRQQIVAELRTDLGRNSVDLAERLVGESLTDDGKRSATVDRFLDELDAMSSSK